MNDGIATTGELDESIVYGPGLRWAAMGTNMIYHLAGGESGMRHMLAQFGPCLKWPWTKLEAPELTETLIDRMVEGTQAQAAGRSIRELERLRDDSLVAVQQVLRQYDIGAGATLRALEERLYQDAAAAGPVSAPERGKPLRLVDTVVRPEWIDYNRHMSRLSLRPGVRRCHGFSVSAGWGRRGVSRHRPHVLLGGKPRELPGRSQGGGGAVCHHATARRR